MYRYHIIRDGEIAASTATKDEAITLIRIYQSQETHYLLRSEYSIIAGEQEYIPYETAKKPGKGKKKGA